MTQHQKRYSDLPTKNVILNIKFQFHIIKKLIRLRYQIFCGNLKNIYSCQVRDFPNINSKIPYTNLLQIWFDMPEQVIAFVSRYASLIVYLYVVCAAKMCYILQITQCVSDEVYTFMLH